MDDVTHWFGGAVRVLFVHAHPDDETISTGGTIAALAEAGREPLVVTLTRGERGEVMPGPLEALAAQHGLALVRQNELKTALGMLHQDRHAFLGVPPARAAGLSPTIYEDSGMQWVAEGVAGADDAAGVDALTRVPAVEVLNDLLTAANEAGAGAIVSYDDAGGYGHPDHVLAHRASRAVASALEIPFYEIVAPPAPGTASRRPGPADPEAADAEAHDIAPWLERKIAALRAYQTQLTVQPDAEGELEIVHVGGQHQEISGMEFFRHR